MSTLTAFYLVQTGIDLINSANANIPSIQIASFKLGSAYGYQVQLTDDNIRGDLIYSGSVTSVTEYDHETIDVQISLASSLGPFDFGEIGLYSSTGILIALLSYPTLQSKLEPVTSAIANPWTIHALIQTTQGTGVFFLNNTNAPQILEYPDTSYLSAPLTMPSQPNAVISHEEAPDNAPTLFVNNDGDWNPVDWTLIANVTPTAVVNDTVTFDGIDSLDGTTQSRYMLGSGVGQFVPIQSVYASTGHLTRTVSWLSASNTYPLYEKTSYRTGVKAISVSDATDLVTALNLVWAAPISTSVLTPNRFGYMSSTIPYYGYGQTPLSSIPNPYNSVNWIPFINALTSCANLLNIPVPPVLSSFSANFLDPILGQTQLTAIRFLLAKVTQDRVNIPINGLETQDFVTSVNSTQNNNRLHYDVTVSFTDPASMYAYFTAGGSVCFLLEDGMQNANTQTYEQLMSRAVFSQLGAIRFTGMTCESLGQLKIKGRGTFPISPFGSGYKISRNSFRGYSSESNAGFFSLNQTTRTEVFSYVQPLNGTTFLELGVYATRNGTSILLELWVNTLTYADYSSGTFTTSIPRQLSVTVFKAKALSSNLTLAYPTLTTASSTSW